MKVQDYQEPSQAFLKKTHTHHIAGFFRGRKLSRISRFCGNSCSFLHENLFSSNSRKFSSAKETRNTVFGAQFEAVLDIEQFQHIMYNVNTMSHAFSFNDCSVSMTVQFQCLFSFNACSVSTTVQFQRLFSFNDCSVSMTVQFQRLISFNDCSVSTTVQFQLSFNDCSVSTTVQFQRLFSFNDYSVSMTVQFQ